jgi:acyl-CoA synthetase (AMP-forming)/AMP-acid ligase II
MTQHLWQLIDNSSQQHNNQVALRAVDKTLSYAELHSAVSQYAAYLQTQGVSSGSKVAILLPRDSSLIVSILAVLACGATYIPLDKRYPLGRQLAILNDSNCQYMITAEKDNQVGVTMLLAPNQVSNAHTLREVKIDSTQPAYIIYTSGSTGKPKGVMISHNNVIAFIKWALTVYLKFLLPLLPVVVCYW